MEEKQDLGNKTNQYFQKLNREHRSSQNIDLVMKEAEHHVENNIETGSLKVPDDMDQHKKQEIMNQLLKKRGVNPFESRYRGFLLNSDREKNQQRYDIFKKIKQEYSKEKTAVVVKSVENKIKQWTTKKIAIDQRKERSSEKKKQIQIQILEELKRQELEKQELEAFRKKQDLMKRLQILSQRKEVRDNFLKESSIRSKEIQLPKYKEIEKRFTEIEEKLKLQQQRLLEEKKHSMALKKEELKQHSEKYQMLRKEREEERKKKFKNNLDGSRSIEERQQFIIMDEVHLQQKQEDAEKRKRRKQFQNKVKSMAVLTKKDRNIENGEELEDRERNDQSIGNSRKRRRSKKDLNAQADPRKLGNDYLKQLKQKGKNFLGRSISLPKIPSAQIYSTKPSYKNYLTEVKLSIKRKKVGDQIQQVKRRCKSKVQTYQQLTKKSSSYQQNMIKKIKQLGRIDKYNDSVQKQQEIDELHARYIKMRLACIDV